jgi:hypothetical protein
MPERDGRHLPLGKTKLETKSLLLVDLLEVLNATVLPFDLLLKIKGVLAESVPNVDHPLISLRDGCSASSAG